MEEKNPPLRGAVCCHDFQCGFEHFFDHALPVRLNPTLRFRCVLDHLWHIGTAPLVDGNAKPAGDKPDDLIARQRIAAAGELDEAPLHAVYDHAADRGDRQTPDGKAATDAAGGPGRGLRRSACSRRGHS